jgi:CRP/FNR family transcriptional regulator, cyclic AMP receptor protein
MPIFGALAGETLAFLVDQSRIRQVARGNDFFREGEPAESLYVLESGRVEVVRTWQGVERVVNALGKGDCFGEMALLDLGPRSASVRAIEDCTAIELRADDLYRLYEHDVAQFALVQMNLAREVSRRLRRTDELLFRAWMELVTPASSSPTTFRAV